LAVSLAVFSMSIFEGWISLSIIYMLEPGVELYTNLLNSTLPVAFLQGLMTPIILQFVIWGEKLFLRDLA
jgi:hypothetical protein